MNQSTKNHLSLIIWTLGLMVIGGIIGSFIKPEISTWYNTLNRSTLTSPNYIFLIDWTILYGMIGACGWLIWHKSSSPNLSIIKTLYVTQLVTGLSLVVLIAMDILGV